MNGLRRNFGVVVAVLMLAAIALSSGAALAGDKQYTLAMSTPSGTTSPTTVIATFTNKGNSSFNSFTLTLPTGYSLIGTPTISASKGTVSYNSTTRVVKVTDIGLPVGSGNNEVITVTMMNVASSGACGPGSASTWTSAVWTGSSLNGNLFTPTGPAATTSLSPLCYTVSGSTATGGTVTCTPSTVSAGGSSTCSVAVNPGYSFTGFSANCGAPTTATSCTVSNVQSAQTVTATFSQINYAINGSTSAGGMVTCSPTSVTYGQSSLCSVAVNPGYTFTGFSANCGAPTTATSCTVNNVQSSQTVTATFVSNTLAITLAPTSAALSPPSPAAPTPFGVTVSITPGGPTVTPDTTACGNATWTSTGSGASTTFTFTIPKASNITSCTIVFSAPNYNSTTLSNLPVYAGVLFCGDYDSVNGPGDFTYDPDLPSTLTGLGSSYVGTPGWGLRRGPNKDGSACIKVNYSCNLDATPNLARCTFDKASGQQATFKYLFLWGPRAPQANGWTDYRPQVSWNIANPDTSYVLPDWVPLLACISDLFPILPTLPTTILPVIPSVAPFTDGANTRAWYQPGQTALVCGAQQGWTAVGSPGNPLLQIWNIVIDESDVTVKGPTS